MFYKLYEHVNWMRYGWESTASLEVAYIQWRGK